MLKLKIISKMKNTEVIYSFNSKKRLPSSINASSNDRTNVTYIRMMVIIEFHTLVNGSSGNNRHLWFCLSVLSCNSLFLMVVPAFELISFLIYIFWTPWSLISRNSQKRISHMSVFSALYLKLTVCL